MTDRPYWDEFAAYADEFLDGVDLKDEDSWKPWYECFFAGAQAGEAK